MCAFSSHSFWISVLYQGSHRRVTQDFFRLPGPNSRPNVSEGYEVTPGIKMDTVAESGRNPFSKHQIQLDLSVENEQADNRRDSRTCLTEPNSQA